MSDVLPLPATYTLRPSSGTAVTVNPTALSQLSAALQQRAQTLRAGMPRLLAAWELAAEALAAERTGAVLADTRAGAGAVLDGLAGSVEKLADTLRRSAASYAQADAAAVLVRPASRGAWIR